jgi:RNA recognition motif-containing protein
LLKGGKSEDRRKQAKDCTIYVSGLLDSLANTGSRELRSLFGIYGEITNVSLDNSGAGEACITYLNPKAANAAIVKMDGSEIKG